MALLKQEQVISMALKFDTENLLKEFLNNLEIELQFATDSWKQEALSKMRGIKFSHEKEQIKAEVDKAIQNESKKIVVFLKANAVALADSYGVGSLMTSDNPGLQEYMNSDRWNKARSGKTIVGRKEGYYTDIFGRQRHSSGTMEGKPLEGRRVYTKKNDEENDYYISPSNPSYALQMAEQWLYKTYLPRAYSNAIKRTNFAKYLKEIN